MPSSPIRVLFANLPVVLRELFTQQLMEQGDIQVVGYSQDNVSIMLQTREGVDVIILGAPRLKPPPGICSHLLNEFPNVRILVYSLEQNALTGYWLGVRKCHVQHINTTTLVESIRTLFNYAPTL